MKKIILSLLIALIIIIPIGGYFSIKQEQKRMFDIFFNNNTINILKFNSIELLNFHKSFYSILKMQKSNDDIKKYNICLFKEEILKQNKKLFIFDQKQLDTTLNTYCNNSKFILDNEEYYLNLSYSCTLEKKCKRAVLSFDDIYLFDTKEAYQKKDKFSTKIDFNDFLSKKLNINNPEEILFFFVDKKNGIGNQLSQYWGAHIYALKKGKKTIPLQETKLNDVFNFEKPSNKIQQFKNILVDFEFYNYWIDFNKDTFVFTQNPVSAKNFKGYESYIQENTKFKTKLTGKNKKISEKMKNEISIAVHIRRGDFKTYNIILDKKYYDQAMTLMKYKFKTPHFYIFSNDIKWVKENFEINDYTTIIDWTTSAEEDLHLMTKCKHYIIANSSFSWWGAFLSDNPNKIVLFPPNGLYDLGAAEMAVNSNWIPVNDSLFEKVMSHNNNKTDL